MLERTAGAHPRRRRSRLSAASCAALAALALAMSTGCSEVAEANTGSTTVVHPSTITVPKAQKATSTTVAAKGEFTDVGCSELEHLVAATPSGGTVDVCAGGWGVTTQRGADNTDSAIVYQFASAKWTERTRRPVNETFAVDQLVAIGMPAAQAATLGVEKPWVTKENLPALIKLLGSVADVHTAIADPCSLVTLFDVDLATSSFAMTTNDTDDCGMNGAHTLLRVANGEVSLKIQVKAAAPADDPATEAYHEALTEFGDIETVDLVICGDPINGDICVSSFGPTPPGR